MTRPGEERQPAARIFRVREGRLLGGVCAGLPDVWGLGTNGLRLLFVVAALLGGIGIVIYLACWLVIPAADHDPDNDPVRSVVLLAWAMGGLVVVVLVAAAAAAATVFGLGWVVFGLAAAVLAASFSPLWARIPQAVALVTVAALTLPAVAVALSPLHLTFQPGDVTKQPPSYRVVDRTVYRSGLGTLLVDLRRTPLPAQGGATLRVEAGLRRTIVALPSNKCVRVILHYHINLFPDRLATLLSGRQATPFHAAVVFGRVYGSATEADPSGVTVSRANIAGPTLTIDFTSEGGSVYVRDYPDNIAPNWNPNWPGYPASPEPRPFVRGLPRQSRQPILLSWRQRVRAEQASDRAINSEMPGPCVS